MGFLKLLNRSSGDDDNPEDEDGPDDEDGPGSKPGSSDDDDDDDNGGGGGRGLLGKLFRKHGKGKSDDSDSDDDPDSGDDEDAAPDEDNSPAMRVRLEGVSDVRPVGSGAGNLASPGETAGGGSGAGKGEKSGGQPAAGPSAEASGTAEAAGSKDEPAATKEQSGSGSALDLSLKDIFEEEAIVDENLKDLADSQKDVLAEDLATELRDFLAALQK